MSEPMSNVEIEDVLSSIRRLVSDDLRPQARSLRESVSPVAPASDKLVLTPALRIVPEAVAESVAASQDTAAEPVFHSVRDVDEAAFIAVADDGGSEAELLHGAGAGEDYDDDGAAAPFDVAAAIPEELFAGYEAAGPVDEHASGATIEGADWADAAEAAVRAELEQDTAQAAYAQFLDDPDEASFDENAIRELVRDIIREELQGTLGERITRNVRKLVRAEIARALAVRDFD